MKCNKIPSMKFKVQNFINLNELIYHMLISIQFGQAIDKITVI